MRTREKINADSLTMLNMWTRLIQVMIIVLPVATGSMQMRHGNRQSITSHQRCSVPRLLPYKPKGLSDQEWAAIKKKDAERLQGKDYGAWGPRFRRVEAPFWASASFLAKTGAVVSGRLSSDMPSKWRRFALRLPRVLLGVLMLGAIVVLASLRCMPYVLLRRFTPLSP